jgi:type IV pilus assembly protein PilE
MKYRRSSGITLIELMIVVVIVSILAAIAVPSYRQYLTRTHRVEAKAALLRIQVAQEKFFLQNNRYITATADLSKPSPNGLDLPTTTPNGMYDISVIVGSTGTSISYTAVATAKGTQLASDVDCSVFTITDTGAKTPADKDCWR